MPLQPESYHEPAPDAIRLRMLAVRLTLAEVAEREAAALATPQPLRLSAVERSMIRPDVAEMIARTRVFDGGPD